MHAYACMHNMHAYACMLCIHVDACILCMHMHACILCMLGMHAYTRRHACIEPNEFTGNGGRGDVERVYGFLLGARVCRVVGFTVFRVACWVGYMMF